MKLFASVLFAALLSTSHTASAGDSAPPESDSTLEWTYPYKADAAKEKRLRDGVEAILKGEVGASPSSFIDKLGPADQVTDIKKNPEALSAKDADQLTFERKYHWTKDTRHYRMVWYIAKKGPTHSPDDGWFAAYLDGTGTIVTRLMRNNLALSTWPYPGE